LQGFSESFELNIKVGVINASDGGLPIVGRPKMMFQRSYYSSLRRAVRPSTTERAVQIVKQRKQRNVQSAVAVALHVIHLKNGTFEALNRLHDSMGYGCN
jgi:hypothetical protein